jgi:microcystin-dependent protein
VGISLNDEKLTGLILASMSNIVPEGFLLCDGRAISRSVYSNLFSISPRTSGIITVATANIITWTNHGLATGQSIQFTTTGILPTGLNVGTVYFIRVINTSTFNLYTTQAQAMNTSSTIGQISFTVTGSGSHTGTVLYWGNGNGSTTFNIPDGQGVYLRGIGNPQNFIDTTPYQIVMGQKLDDAMENHQHIFNHSPGGYSLGGGGSHGLFTGYGALTAPFTNGASVGSMNSGKSSSETRVKSIGVNYFIKY